MTEDIRPRIENSERGITLNKSLAWTILTALIAGGFWVGSQVTALQSITQDNKARSADQSAEITVINNRLRSIETQQARSDEKFSNILGYLTRIDARLERIEQGK
ncbi:hypothetical protein [Thioclava sp. DLFJ4-1]|uniref:hypothetical protein n=1 Tax=Thioclava sp. DLFJ4-1 TaxID=1915313 RepID=UPI0009960AC9|nr:hypothetical protein [Thioclava sp. DLFJ4-1]OOY16709.1 hypothetical protein BMI85_06490 [Thioclava sp. DLFJ4-1]